MTLAHKVPVVSTGRFSVLSVDRKDGGMTGANVVATKEPLPSKALGTDPCNVKGYTMSQDCVAISLELASPGSLVSKTIPLSQQNTTTHVGVTSTKENQTKTNDEIGSKHTTAFDETTSEITAREIQPKFENLQVQSKTPVIKKEQHQTEKTISLPSAKLVHQYPVVSTNRFSVLSVDGKDGKSHQPTKEPSSTPLPSTILGTDPCKLHGYTASNDCLAASLELASPGAVKTAQCLLLDEKDPNLSTEWSSTTDHTRENKSGQLMAEGTLQYSSNVLPMSAASESQANLDTTNKTTMVMTTPTTTTESLKHNYQVVSTARFAVLSVDGKDGKTQMTVSPTTKKSPSQSLFGTDPFKLQNYKAVHDFAAIPLEIASPGVLSHSTTTTTTTTTTENITNVPVDQVQPLPQLVAAETTKAPETIPAPNMALFEKNFDKNTTIQTNSIMENKLEVLQENGAFAYSSKEATATKSETTQVVSKTRNILVDSFAESEISSVSTVPNVPEASMDQIDEDENKSPDDNIGNVSSSNVTKSRDLTLSDTPEKGQNDGSLKAESLDATQVSRRLLVLVSNQSFDREVIANQERAYTILQSKNIAYETLDGADLANKDRRNELFALSGLRAKYPQFFLVNYKGTVTFWGDWERFEYANEDGTLNEYYGSDAPSSNTSTTIAPPESNGHHPTKVLNGGDGEAVTNSQDKEIITISPPCVAKRLLVLVSNQSLDRQVVANQQLAYTILQSKNIAYDTLDGADLGNKDRRNELFGISGLRAKYPQFFLVAEDGSTTFWGDWERFEYANEDGTFVEDIGLVAAPRLEPGNTTTRTVVARVDASVNAVNTLATTTISTSSSATVPEHTKTALVLLSRTSTDHEVRANQDRLLSLLNERKIAFETIDGSDESNYVRRDELFTISGTRDVYPQLFAVENSKTSVCRDIDGWVLGNADNAQGKSPEVSSTGGSGDDIAATARAMATENLEGTEPTGQDVTQISSKVSEDVISSTTEAQRSGIEVDITIYGASSFVARHVLAYLAQASLGLSKVLKITLAGRSREKLERIVADLTQKMTNLKIINEGTEGGCEFDVFIAESAELLKLRDMAKRTRVVLNCAGPFARYGSNVVDACAFVGADYVDITGEVSWASEMRLKYGDKAKQSGSRIISFCGFDSVPSDLAIFAAVDALRKAVPHGQVEIERGVTWHAVLGGANGGTAQTVVEMSLNMPKCFGRRVPFLLDDPLALTHPRFRVDDRNDPTRDRLALSEWANQLLSFDTIFKMGVSIPFFMAPVNAKIVHASAVAMGYGPEFIYRERFLPTGFRMTTSLRLISLVPALITQVCILALMLVLKLPTIGQKFVDTFLPPGQGSNDLLCQHGHAEVYAEVSSRPNEDGSVMRANSFLSFQGDPGNWVTAQCVCEAALALLLNREELPPRSADGFGTPAELLGRVLLTRLLDSQVRPVHLATHVRLRAPRLEWRMYP